MPALISRRAFIQWLPHGPSEPTSTLVLTTSSGRFVDVRLRKEPKNPYQDPARTVEDKIDWAFSGISSTVDIAPGSSAGLAGLQLETYLPYKVESADIGQSTTPTHTVWQHAIDSRAQDASGISDGGDMQYSPAIGLTFETGCMVEPETGVPTDYVEGWQDEQIIRARNCPTCVVMEMESAEMKAKGILIMLGHYMQGVARLGDHFSLVKLGWTEQAGWQVEQLIGYMAFPYHIKMHTGIKVGDSFKLQTSFTATWDWIVTEVEA